MAVATDDPSRAVASLGGWPKEVGRGDGHATRALLNLVDGGCACMHDWASKQEAQG